VIDPRIALLFWLPVAVFVSLRLPRSMVWPVLYLSALLLLAEGNWWDVRYLPPIGKRQVAVLVGFAFCLAFYRRELWRALRPRWPLLLLGLLAVSALGTALTNSDVVPLRIGALSGLRPYDAGGMWVEDLLYYGLPFLLARALCRKPADLWGLAIVLAVAGIAYSLLALIEVVLSPQLHKWVYGFYTHSFAQTKRFGGWRPQVFMLHGIELARFLSLSTLMTLVFFGARRRIGKISALPLAAYMCVVMALTKSLSAITYVLVGVPVLLFLSPKTQLRLAVAIAAFVLVYPAARLMDLIPAEQMVSVAEYVDEERGRSLAFRLENERLLMDRAESRLVLGWGGFRRNRIIDDAGNEATTDGYWILALGKRGLLGLTAVFSLLLVPALLASRRIDRVRRRSERVLIAGLTLALCLGSVDLLPNGLFDSTLFLISGSLLGAVEGLRPRQGRRAASAPASAGGPAPREAREARAGRRP